MDRSPQALPVTQPANLYASQKLCQTVRCVRAWAGQITLAGGKTSVPVLELEFRSSKAISIQRRFLLDRRHPQSLQGFLEGFLGHPITRLWELEPEMLVGRQGPLPTPAETEAYSLLRNPV